jgi:hypothetical protein
MINDQRISELEKEIDQLEQEMLRIGPGTRAYNRLKNEQWNKINELKKLKMQPR